MSRFTGPGRFTALGSNPQSRVRAEELRARARAVVGALQNQVTLGNIWQGTRVERISDDAYIVAMVDATYPDNPIVQARIFVARGQAEAEQLKSLVSGLSMGSNAYFLFDSTQQLDRPGYFFELSISDGITMPSSAVAMEQFDQSDSAPYNNISPFWLPGRGSHDWENTDGDIHITTNAISAQTCERLTFPSTFGTLAGSTLYKDGYVYADIPSGLGRYCGHYVGSNSATGELELVVLTWDNSIGSDAFALAAYSRPYEPTPYISNELGDWAPLHYRVFTSAEQPEIQELFIFPGQIKFNPGFLMNRSGTEGRAIGVYFNSTLDIYVYGEFIYSHDDGFTLDGSWKVPPITPFNGGAPGNGSVISSVRVPATFSVDIDWPGGITTATTPDPCNPAAGDVPLTTEYRRTRSHTIDAGRASFSLADVQAMFDTVTLVNVEVTTKALFGIDYDWDTGDVQRLYVDVEGATIVLSSDSYAEDNGEEAYTWFCVGGDGMFTSTYAHTGLWTQDVQFTLSNLQLKINSTVVDTFESMSVVWDHDYNTSMSGGRESTDPINSQYTSANGSATYASSYSVYHEAITAMYFCDLRFQVIGFNKTQLTGEITAAGTGTYFVQDVVPGVESQEPFVDWPIYANSDGSTEIDRAYVYAGGALELISTSAPREYFGGPSGLTIPEVNNVLVSSNPFDGGSQIYAAQPLTGFATTPTRLTRFAEFLGVGSLDVADGCYYAPFTDRGFVGSIDDTLGYYRFATLQTTGQAYGNTPFTFDIAVWNIPDRILTGKDSGLVGDVGIGVATEGSSAQRFGTMAWGLLHGSIAVNAPSTVLHRIDGQDFPFLGVEDAQEREHEWGSF